MEALKVGSIPHRVTLERAPGRCLTFLLGVGRTSVIRGLLETRGYTDEEHERGWKLLRAVDPSVPGAGASDAGNEGAVRESVSNLDLWDNQNLPIADLALRKRCPEVHAYVFGDGLAPADGIESVRVVATFLTRVGAVAQAANDGKKSAEKLPFTAAQARNAMKLLDARGIDAQERATVHAWLSTAQRGATAVAPDDDDATDEADAQEALVALYDWITEWSLIARKVLKRRAHLITLGLAEKKPTAKKSPGTTPKPA